MVDIRLEKNVFEENDRVAAANRALFREHGVLAVNLIGSPGSGKTTLLEATLHLLLESGMRPGVIEGDLETSRDAERIRALGVPAVQINTRGGCHLDAAQVSRALQEMPLDALEVLFIENVGNLVCPTAYDLGERAKVIVLSVPEGHDKPAKYAGAFHRAAAVVVSKSDLLPHTDFDMAAAREDLAAINPGILVLPLSARTGEGMDAWVGWLQDEGK